jgi:hypothetical protein
MQLPFLAVFVCVPPPRNATVSERPSPLFDRTGGTARKTYWGTESFIGAGQHFPTFVLPASKIQEFAAGGYADTCARMPNQAP